MAACDSVTIVTNDNNVFPKRKKQEEKIDIYIIYYIYIFIYIIYNINIVTHTFSGGRKTIFSYCHLSQLSHCHKTPFILRLG